MAEPQTVHDHRRQRVPATDGELALRRYAWRVSSIWLGGLCALSIVAIAGVTVLNRIAPVSAAQVTYECVRNQERIISTKMLVVCENVSAAALDNEWSRPRRRVAEAGE